MKFSRLLPFAGSLLFLAGLAAQDVQPQPAPAPNEKLLKLVMEAQQLHGRQQLGEALAKLNEAEALDPDNAIVNNVRGSVYTAMRDFPKAREAFDKARTKSPNSFEPRFNLTEIDYVEGKFAKAEEGFKKLLNDYAKVKVEVRHLTQFKIMVCELKQNKVDDAVETSKAFTFMDDTPAYYFAQSALAFYKKNDTEGREWIGKAGKIFKDPDNIPYLDTLMEARWVQSLTVPDVMEPPVKTDVEPAAAPVLEPAK